MTQNGPYPGPPSQPWNNNQGSSDEPYTEPADPWGDHPTESASSPNWGHHQASVPPATDTGHSTIAPQPNYASPPPPVWGHQPQPQQPRKRNTPIVALVIVLGLLICGGLGTTAWLLSGRDDDARGSTADPTASATTNQVTDPQPRSSEDARFVTKGQCVRNEGNADNPEMKIVACASGTFEVLKRVDGRTTGESDAEQKCSKVPGYTKWYFYDSELDSLDFVLCLKER
ncbi:hypothetical protein AB0M54_31375 [Actinoplanes sp. NPDC051470]|uniref:LppU/SCO3897 family protein n=1 Tax=unclassified Actinoplanes TaxID=2626549 RepID=UPI0034161DEE